MFSRKPKSPIEPVIDVRVPGLVNNAATCFLNSTAQSLAASSHVHDTLLAGSDIPRLAALDTGREAADLDASPTLAKLRESVYPPDLPLTGALNVLLRRLWQTEAVPGRRAGRPLDPQILCDALAKKNDEYDGNSQQDAHEVLLCLLDGIRLEEIDIIKKLQPPPAPLSEDQQRQRRRTTRRNTLIKPTFIRRSTEQDGATPNSLPTAGSYFAIDRSVPTIQSEDESSSSSDDQEDNPPAVAEAKLTPFIDTLFSGSLASYIVCEECKHVSKTTEPFFDLSLAVRLEEDKTKRGRFRSLLTKGLQPPTRAEKSPIGDKSDSSVFFSDSKATPSGLTLTRPAESEGELSSSERRSLDASRLKPALSIRKNGRDGSQTSRSSSPSDQLMPLQPTSSRGSVSSVASAQYSKAYGNYIKSILAEVPEPHRLPLDGLRIAQPNDKAKIESPGDKGDANSQGTGVYAALRRFTAVEMLEGENAFQCRKCWKIANPKAAGVLRARRSKRRPTITPHTAKQEEKQHSSDKTIPHAALPKLIVDGVDRDGAAAPRADVSDSSDSESGFDGDQESDAPSPVSAATSLFSSRSEHRHAPPPTQQLILQADMKIPPKRERFIKQRAQKRYLLSSLPSVLLLHFNRFQQMKGSAWRGSFSSLRKVDDFVSFPLELDLSPFLAPLAKAPSRMLEAIGKPSQLQDVDPRRQRSRYRLSAIVVHTGSMASGHYISFVNATRALPNLPMNATQPAVERQWLYCSDEEVRPANTTEVMQCRAYILLYDRE